MQQQQISTRTLLFLDMLSCFVSKYRPADAPHVVSISIIFSLTLLNVDHLHDDSVFQILLGIFLFVYICNRHSEQTKSKIKKRRLCTKVRHVYFLPEQLRTSSVIFFQIRW